MSGSYKPGSVRFRATAIYLECTSPRISSTQPGCTTGRSYSIPICACFGWGLPSLVITDKLVRFYRTVSAFLAWRASGRRLGVRLSLMVFETHSLKLSANPPTRDAPEIPRNSHRRESSFLWRYPSGHPVQLLAGILPCEARTFLIHPKVCTRLSDPLIVVF